jgi:hypothetical protein
MEAAALSNRAGTVWRHFPILGCLICDDMFVADGEVDRPPAKMLD